MSEALMSPSVPVAPQVVVAGINERQFFQSMKHLFAGTFSMVGELMQNSRRAGATKVEFQFEPDKSRLTVTDDGHGIRDFAALIQLCQSSWDEQITLTDRPFGMGLFSLFFAAQSVTFRSHAHQLAVCLEDVVNKRALDVHAAPSAPSSGTSIVLEGLCEPLVSKQWACRSTATERFGDLAAYRFAIELATRASGFPIPVFMNGIECERPAAQAALPGELIEIGFVSVPGIHLPACTDSLPNVMRRNAVALFLQGLPIGPVAERGAIIVHLAGEVFTAKMPDRAHLYDEENAMKRITAAIKAALQAHLVRQKALLSGKQFVLKHWDDCAALGVMHLVNDIPWVPLSIFDEVFAVTEGDAKEGIGPFRPPAQLIMEDPNLISREQVLRGQVKGWRHAPRNPSESASAALALKVMQREGILAVDRIPEGHWLNTCTPDSADLVFNVMPINARGLESYECFDWCEGCSIELVDSLKVTITSTVDPLMRLELDVVDDWVLVPRDHATEGFEQDMDFREVKMVCYVPSRDSSPDHPVDALSSFRDENDSYRDEWRENAAKLWDGLVSGMRGESVAIIVGEALDAASIVPTVAHCPHMAIVRSIRYVDGDGAAGHPRFDVADPQDPQLWVDVAQQFNALEASLPLAERIKAAFEAAVKPGELVGPRT